MHELSIVNALIELCEKNALKEGASLVEEIHVKIGPLSGVELPLFKSCFETFKKNTICSKAKLIINKTALLLSCFDCGFKGKIEKNVFFCPKCQSPNTELLEGDELYLLSLVMS